MSTLRAESLKVSHQLTLTESVKSKSAYNKESDRYRQISRKLAILIGSTNLPTRIVENLELRLFTHCEQPVYTPFQEPG